MRKLISVIFLFALSWLLLQDVTYIKAQENNTIIKGVFIDQVDVSNMTREEAEEAVKEFIDGLPNKVITVNVNENVVNTTLGEIGFKCETYDYIDQAISLGKHGNLIKRYKDLKDIEQGKIVYPLTYSIDENRIKEFIATEASVYDVEPVNATMTRKDKKFVYTKHILGKTVEVDETIDLIKAYVLNDWNHEDIVIDAVITENPPIYTKEVMEMCSKKLGSFSTEYTDSARGRAANLANGARLINNTVIYPGEVFSAYDYLTPFTKDNGYYTAGAYKEGKVIDSIGGGACQVTTTLYNAVLNSELEVIERKSHSMTISYTELSRDAAIAGTYKDFKFKNNTDVPILIEGYTVGRKITFNIWGYESRDIENRRIEFETRILSKTKPPEDVVTEDPGKPITYRKVTQSDHTGYKTELYKVVYEDDVEVSRTLINSSFYLPAPRYVTIGTKELEEQQEEQEEQGGTGNPDQEDTDKQEGSDNDQEDPDNDQDDVGNGNDNQNNEVDEDKAYNDPLDEDIGVGNSEEQEQDDFYWDPIWDFEDNED